MTHDLKCWPEPFRAVREGKKLCELRVDDREYEVGDYLALREYDPEGDAYSGNIESVLVTHIVRDAPHFGLMDGYCLMSIARAGGSR